MKFREKVLAAYDIGFEDEGESAYDVKEPWERITEVGTNPLEPKVAPADAELVDPAKSLRAKEMPFGK